MNQKASFDFVAGGWRGLQFILKIASTLQAVNGEKRVGLVN